MLNEGSYEGRSEGFEERDRLGFVVGETSCRDRYFLKWEFRNEI